jgi:hypothetical protein
MKGEVWEGILISWEYMANILWKCEKNFQEERLFLKYIIFSTFGCVQFSLWRFFLENIINLMKGVYIHQEWSLFPSLSTEVTK